MGRFLNAMFLGLAVAATSVSLARGELTVTATSDKPIPRVGLQEFQSDDDLCLEGDELCGRGLWRAIGQTRILPTRS